jgi:negative regulator of replication initiation
MSFVSADVAYNEALYRYQNAKSDSEKEKAYAELKRLVEQAAKEAGFENAIPEQTRAYKVRTKAAPKKTTKKK